MAGGRGAGPHVKNSLMHKGSGALWSPVRGCQRAGGLATFPQQRRWETPAGGQPSHAPGRPLPSANPGTMRACAIQAFQPNPAIEIQGFNLNAIPWAGGRGREGGEGDAPAPPGRGMPFPHPIPLCSRSPSRLSGPWDALKSHGSGWTAGAGAAEDGDRKLCSVVERSRRRSWQPLSWQSWAGAAGHPCPPAPCPPAPGTPQRPQNSLGGSLSTLRYTHLPSSSHPGHSPPGSILREEF